MPVSPTRSTDYAGMSNWSDRRQENFAPGMTFVPDGTFLMGSDRHYPEEAPALRVSVDSFYIDRAPVINGEFRGFVNARGHITFAEMRPDPKDYFRGILRHQVRRNGDGTFDLSLDHRRPWGRLWMAAKDSRSAVSQFTLPRPARVA